MDEVEKYKALEEIEDLKEANKNDINWNSGRETFPHEYTHMQTDTLRKWFYGWALPIFNSYPSCF